MNQKSVEKLLQAGTSFYGKKMESVITVKLLLNIAIVLAHENARTV